jgi:CubicO group peptidase (beta-lactamase class C family)
MKNRNINFSQGETVSKFKNSMICFFACLLLFLLTTNAVAQETSTCTNSKGLMITGYNNTAPRDFSDLMVRFEGAKKTLLSTYKTAGVAAVFIDRCGTQYETIYKSAAGYQAQDSSAIDVDKTIFQVGSISKPVSAWGLYKMYQNNLVDLNKPIDPVAQNILGVWYHTGGGYLYPKVQSDPDNPKYWAIPNYWALNPKYIGNVTLSQILLHRSGLHQSLFPTLASGYNGWNGTESGLNFATSYDNQREQVTGGYRLPTLTQELDGKNSAFEGPAKLYVQPDKSPFYYSGAGYAVMQKVMENICRKKYYTNSSLVPEYQLFDKYMKEKVFLNPELNMNNSTYIYNTAMKGSMALGYSEVDWDGDRMTKTYAKYKDGIVIKEYNPPVFPNFLFTVKAVTGLYTTAPDLAKFVRVMITKNSTNDAILKQIINKDIVYYNGTYCNVYKSDDTLAFVGRVIYENNIRYFADPVKGTKCDTATQDYLNNLIQSGEGRIKILNGFWGHSGDNLGYRSLILFNPSNGIGLVVLTNSDSGDPVMNDIAAAWWAQYVDKLGI